MFAPNCAETPRLASSFAGREFYDFGRDFLLSDEALAPLQLRKLAFDLLSRRRHRLHARLVSQTRMTMLTVWRPSVHQSILMGYFSRGLANSSSSATTRQ